MPTARTREVRDLRAVGELDAESEHLALGVEAPSATTVRVPDDVRLKLVLAFVCDNDKFKVEACRIRAELRHTHRRAVIACQNEFKRNGSG